MTYLKKYHIIFFLILSFIAGILQAGIINQKSTILNQGQNDFLSSLDSSVVSGSIYIVGDTALANFPNKTGSGTYGDPYIINGYEISNASTFGSCIYIKGTTKYLRIKNCTVKDSNMGGSNRMGGIRLENCSNVEISNNTATNNDAAIVLKNSFNITVFNNNCSKNTINTAWDSRNSGVYLTGCNETKILFNKFDVNTNGVFMEDTNENITISNNAFSAHQIDAIQTFNNTISHVVKNLLISNNSITHSSNTYYAVRIRHIETLRFLNNTINSRRGIIFETPQSNHLIYVEDNKIQSPSSSTTDYNGIYLKQSSNVTIKGNTISGCRSGIFLEKCTKINILNNNISNANYFGIRTSFSTYCFIMNNTVNLNLAFGMYLADSNHLQVENNTAHSNAKDTSLSGSLAGIRLHNTDFSSVTRNIATWNEWSGIVLTESNDNNISENRVLYNQFGDAVYLETSNNNEVSRNFIMHQYYQVYDEFDDAGNGINLYDSFFNTISNNTIYNNSENGIYIYYSTDNYVFDNLIYENGMSGVVIDDSDQILIVNNTILSNLLNGIHTYYASLTNITHNLIKLNGQYGLFLEQNNFDTIAYNDFIGNIFSQAFNDSCEEVVADSIFDNFWSDYEDRYPTATNNGVHWSIPYEFNVTLMHDIHPRVNSNRGYQDDDDPDNEETEVPNFIVVVGIELIIFMGVIVGIVIYIRYQTEIKEFIDSKRR